MLIFALICLALLFVLLFFGRVAGARRGVLGARWPVLLFAGAAIFALLRNSLWLALALFVAAGIAFAWAEIRPRTSSQKFSDEPGDAEARTILGVSAGATAQEIRAAYRSKMARAHPDRGGTHAEAARLTAARDRLLRRRR